MAEVLLAFSSADYDLSVLDPQTLNGLSAPELIELIMLATRDRAAVSAAK